MSNKAELSYKIRKLQDRQRTLRRKWLDLDVLISSLREQKKRR
jgi:hypothetical protein